VGSRGRVISGHAFWINRIILLSGREYLIIITDQRGPASGQRVSRVHGMGWFASGLGRLRVLVEEIPPVGGVLTRESDLHSELSLGVR